MLRTGLESLIRAHPDWELSGSFEGIEDIGDKNADVVVVLTSDTETLPEVSSTPLVLIWPQMDGAQLMPALRAGIRAVLPQDCTAEELTAAMAAAAAGLSSFRTADLELVPDTFRPARPRDAVQLSPRELEVLRLLAEGLANKEIAYRLGISEHTVKFHVNSIFTRMDVSTRAEAVAIGIRQGSILL